MPNTFLLTLFITAHKTSISEYSSYFTEKIIIIGTVTMILNFENLKTQNHV